MSLQGIYCRDSSCGVQESKGREFVGRREMANRVNIFGEVERYGGDIMVGGEGSRSMVKDGATWLCLGHERLWLSLEVLLLWAHQTGPNYLGPLETFSNII